jgi:hypothetical protein
MWLPCGGKTYTPPTPVWAGVVFILAGLPLMIVGFGAVILGLASGNVLRVPGMACEGFLGFLGLLAIIQGIRTLARPGKV